MKKQTAAERREQKWALLMIAPTIIGLLVLNYYPLIDTFILSFTKTSTFGASKFVMFDNYIKMFQTPEFWKATWNTIVFCILTVPVGIALALLVAILLNSKVKFQGGFRTIFFLPMVCAPAAIAMVWRWMFNGEYGIINAIIGQKIGWLTDPKTAIVGCAIVAIWSAIGYDAVLLLSGLQNISKSYYEAAEIDGASKIRQFFSITVPMISPTLFVTLIMRMMASLKVYDLIYMMIDVGNPVRPDVQSLMYLFYQEAFVAGNKGYAAAIVIWTILLIGIVTVFQFIGQKKWVNYEV